MPAIEFLESQPVNTPKAREPENWYVEPFTKRSGCKTPGQCGGDCDCGCPYNTMTEVEYLPLIEEIAKIFPDEWLAFIVSRSEDEELTPMHGKLVAHSPHPNEVYDAVNTVLWNQHVYVFFNGDFAAMQSSYGSEWAEIMPLAKRAYSGPQPTHSPDALPHDLMELIYSAIDQLYDTPQISEAIRRLRLARVKAASQANRTLMSILDSALDKLETPLPLIDEVIWYLEEACAELEAV